MVRSLDIELEGCSDSSCEDHPVKEWPVLYEICDHHGSNLKDMVFHLSLCSTDWAGSIPWIVRFADDMRRRITSCTVWKRPDESVMLIYNWAASTSQGSLVNLMRRTVRGELPWVRIWGDNDTALSIPANFFEVLSGLAEDGMFGLQLTNIKIIHLNHLNNCRMLSQRSTSAAFEDEELATWEGFLAQVAMDPRPRNPEVIILPKVNTQCPT